jgi:uncharacterized protein YjiS (DUF1127 family)
MHTIRISVPIPAVLVQATVAVAQAPVRVGQAIAAGLLTVFDWRERAVQRRMLADLDDRLLRDLGLTRADVYKECRKQFWEA